VITIIFDTETTGLIKNAAKPLSMQPSIIEFGGIKVDEELNEIDRINFMVNPRVPLPPIITKITGITKDDLRDAKPFSHHFDALVGFFKGCERMIAHNLPFDRNMMLFELKRMGAEYRFPWPSIHTCTAENGKSLFNGKYTKLEKMYEHFYNKDPKQTHRAVGDCEILLDVARALNKEGVL